MLTWTGSPRDCYERTTRFRRCKCPVEGITFMWHIRTARFMQERFCRLWRYLAVSSGGGWCGPKIQDPRSKIQGSTKHQNPNRYPVDGWELGIWIFSGTWILELGAFTPFPTIRSCSNPGTCP